MKRYMYSDLYEDMYETEDGEYVDADVAQELYDALKNLELSANTVRYCYSKRPENFASALNRLQWSAQIAHEILAKADE